MCLGLDMNVRFHEKISETKQLTYSGIAGGVYDEMELEVGRVAIAPLRPRGRFEWSTGGGPGDGPE